MVPNRKRANSTGNRRKLPPALTALIATGTAAGVCLGIAAFWLINSDRVAADALFGAVLREIENRYVDEVPRQRLVDNAVRGVLAGLDDHSRVLRKQDLLTLEAETAGRFGDVGVELGVVRGRLVVLKPLPDTPASRAGIAAGDRLLEVDHRPVAGLGEAARALRGKPATNVHLRISRPVARGRDARLAGSPDAPSAGRGTPPPNADAGRRRLDFELTRVAIAVPSARGRRLAPGYGYVRITQFNHTTADDLERTVARLGAPGPLAGLIVDLRDNPGGLLAMSVTVADAFLKSGVIVSVVSRRTGTERFEADAAALLDGVPMAVLVNGGSASAAEVVAAAWQAHGRATVVGTRSHGKASVQSVVYFNGRIKHAALLTTARYVTPSGWSLDDAGVVPDVAVPPRPGERELDYRPRVVATALRHLRARGEG